MITDTVRPLLQQINVKNFCVFLNISWEGCCYLERKSWFVAHYQHQSSTINKTLMAWWFYVKKKKKKKKAQLGSPLSCQSCGGKTTIQFNTFSQVPQRNINKTKPHIYTDCTRFRRCIENKNMLVKQTDIVAKCIAIIWWLQHQQQQTNSESIIKPAPPVPSAQILFHTVLSRWRLGSITCPRTLDWRQLLRHFCRSDSHPEKQKRTSISTTGVILNRVIVVTNHSACLTFCDVTVTQFQQQWPQHLINL